MEHYFKCPYCGEEISMIFDLTEYKQCYIEDCEVCCNPVEIKFITDGETLTEFEANTSE